MTESKDKPLTPAEVEEVRKWANGEPTGVTLARKWAQRLCSMVEGYRDALEPLKGVGPVASYRDGVEGYLHIAVKNSVWAEIQALLPHEHDWKIGRHWQEEIGSFNLRVSYVCTICGETKIRNIDISPEED